MKSLSLLCGVSRPVMAPYWCCQELGVLKPRGTATEWGGLQPTSLTPKVSSLLLIPPDGKGNRLGLGSVGLPDTLLHSSSNIRASKPCGRWGFGTKPAKTCVFPHEGMAHGETALEPGKARPASICEIMCWQKLWQISSQTLCVVQWEFLGNTVFNKLASSMHLRSRKLSTSCRSEASVGSHRLVLVIAFAWGSYDAPGCMHAGKTFSGGISSICGK